MVDVERGEDEAPEKHSKSLLCEICSKEPSKYKCPRCSYRTCSVQCSKKHKTDLQCSGERSPASFSIVRRLSDCSVATLAEDQKFLKTVGKLLQGHINKSAPFSVTDCSSEEYELPVVKELEIPNSDSVGEKPSTFFDIDPKDSEEDPQHLVGQCLTVKQRYLCSNAQRRRIWLTIPKGEKEDGSRHEQFSDTIFWTIDLIFRRQVQVDEQEMYVSDYIYSAKCIPESICVSTLVRQFIKPKKVGPVVNRDELDEEKLLPFQEVGIDRLTVYMPVPLENKERFYVVDMNKTILYNLRNRYIVGHPTFIITLDTQMSHYVMLSEQEAQELREARRARNMEERRIRTEFRGDKFRNRNSSNKGLPMRGRFMNQRRYPDEDAAEINNFLEKRKRGNDFVNDNCGISNSSSSCQNIGFYEVDRRGCYEKRGRLFNRGNPRKNFRGFAIRKPDLRGKGRVCMHPLEMSPAQLAAADASQSLNRQQTYRSPENEVVLAWAKAVGNHFKQESKEESSKFEIS